MVFKRYALGNLEAWRNRTNRKPLIIRGARQVGKTTLVMEFAKSYKYFILLDLDKSSEVEFFNKYTVA